MLSTQHAVISNKRKRELKDYSLNKLYIALKIIIISSTIGMQNAYAVDLPSADAGCDTGTVTCTVTSALGTDFTVTSDITASVNAIDADATVTGSTFTVNNGISVIGGGRRCRVQFCHRQQQQHGDQQRYNSGRFWY